MRVLHDDDYGRWTVDRVDGGVRVGFENRDDTSIGWDSPYGTGGTWITFTREAARELFDAIDAEFAE